MVSLITVHDKSETVFTANGYGSLNPEIINPQVTETTGADYALTFNYPADGTLAARLLLEEHCCRTHPDFTVASGVSYLADTHRT